MAALDTNPYPAPQDGYALPINSALLPNAQNLLMTGSIWTALNAFKFNLVRTSMTSTSTVYVDVIRMAIYQSTNGAMPAAGAIPLVASWDIFNAETLGLRTETVSTVNVKRGYYVLVFGESPLASGGARTQLRMDSWNALDMRAISNVSDLVAGNTPGSFFSDIAIAQLPASITTSDTANLHGQGSGNDIRLPNVRFQFIAE